jgi:hypothetical protein
LKEGTKKRKIGYASPNKNKEDRIANEECLNIRSKKTPQGCSCSLRVFKNNLILKM